MLLTSTVPVSYVIAWHFLGCMKGHNSRTGRVFKSKIKPGLTFVVPDIVHKFQMICLRET